MPTRQLTSDNGIVREYLVRDDGGQEIGTDVEAVRTPQQVNETKIRSRVAATLAANATYLALPTRTSTQIAVQVEALTRQNIALGRLLVGLLDTTDGT